jgi:hypothetical protein
LDSGIHVISYGEAESTCGVRSIVEFPEKLVESRDVVGMLEMIISRVHGMVAAPYNMKMHYT